MPKRRTVPALFAVVGQRKHAAPRRLSWRNSLRTYFDVDPLIDSRGESMRWAVGKCRLLDKGLCKFSTSSDCTLKRLHASNGSIGINGSSSFLTARQAVQFLLVCGKRSQRDGDWTYLIEPDKTPTEHSIFSFRTETDFCFSYRSRQW